MILDQGTLLYPGPLKLSIGSIRKPKLSEIYYLSFQKFEFYEVMLKASPKTIYTDILGDQYKEYWDNLNDHAKDEMTVYSIIESIEAIKDIYLEILNFFFIEKVIYHDGYFIIVNPDIPEESLTKDDVIGFINSNSFITVIEILQQICCIFEKDSESKEEIKFKNEFTRKMYEKMQKAKQEQKARKAKEASKDLSLPNIISAVSNMHPSINPINIWDMTVYQLCDSFNRLQVNKIYEINRTTVAVWGDEKKTFDSSLWYKNNVDNNKDS